MALALDRVESQLIPVVNHLSRLLHARVWMTDAQRIVVASSERDGTGRRLPVRVTTRCGEAPLGLAAPASLASLGIAQVVVEQLDGEPISPRLAQALIELIASDSAHHAERADAHELKNHFVYNLLFETALDEEALIRQGHMLGIDLTIPRAAIVIDATSYILPSGAGDGQSELEEALMRERARRVINSVVSFFHLPSDTICAYVGSGEVVILKASSARDLDAWRDPTQLSLTGSDELAPSWAGLPALKRAGAALLSRIHHDTNTDISLGIGRYHPGVRGLERSYQDARAALKLGRHFHGANQVHCLDSLGIAAFIGLADERTKVELAQRLLGPLDHEPELIETVQEFFAAERSPSITAQRLCVHRNTLTYRLEKISSLTGLDPRRFDDAVQIRLALLVRSLQI